MRDKNGKWLKGKSPNPNGRPPVLLPEVQKAIDANKNAIKVLILQEIDPHVKHWVQQIIEKGCIDGDVVKLKMLLEIALGKIVDDPPEFPVTEEEKLLIVEFRRRKKEQDERAIVSPPSVP